MTDHSTRARNEEIETRNRELYEAWNDLEPEATLPPTVLPPEREPNEETEEPDSEKNQNQTDNTGR